jgi:glycosyltransferase involved in cell wall biosynthesis
LRILHIIDSLIEAGAEALVKDMVPRMQARGIDVSVAVLKELDSPFEREVREKGIPFLPTAAGGIYSPAHVVRLANHIDEFDLVQLYLFPAQLFAALAAMLAGSNVPLVLSEQTTSHRRRTNWLHQFDTWMYSHYTAIACASEGIAASLREWIPGVSRKITVIQNGIDVRKFQQAEFVSRASLGINESSCILLYVASFQSRKDHGTLLRALKEIPDADLVLVGDGELREQFERQARSSGIAGRVHFLGRRKDVAELLNMADIYVHVPAFEGFGIAVAEAMAAGKPIVASDVPGLAQVVGDAGILIPPGNSSLLATEVRRLIESRERRSQLSRAAVQRANQFGIENTVDGYIDLYKSILTNPVPGSPKLKGADRLEASARQKVELGIQ